MLSIALLKFDSVLCASGDSGYPLEPWLLTPLAAPVTQAERAYNNAHSKTRAVIERCFGVLKSRFRCLDKTGGTLLYSAEKTCYMVTACAVLHNMCISNDIETDIDAAVMARHAAIQPAPLHAHVLPLPAAAGPNAVDVRRRVINQF